MAYNAANIRTAIAELLEGNIGADRVVAVGTFAEGVFEAQRDSVKQAHVLRTSTAPNWFDVLLQPSEPHEATALSQYAQRIDSIEVSIRVWRHMNTTVQKSQRNEDMANLSDALHEAFVALRWPGNLDETAASGSTLIVSGLMRDVVCSDINEDKNSALYSAEISGVIDVVTTDAPASVAEEAPSGDAGILAFDEPENSGLLALL